MDQIIVFDVSNIAYICAHRFLSSNGDAEAEANSDVYLLNKLEEYMRDIYRKFSGVSPNNKLHVLFACDSQTHVYWRNDVYPEYKQNRPMTVLRMMVRASIDLFLEKHKKLSICEDNCEADDVIYVLRQKILEHDDMSLIIVSTDRDFMQLVGPRVRLYNPKDRKFRSSKNSCKYDLFIKSIRGDRSDNISSAFPYVTTKRLNKAFAEDLEMDKLLNVKREDNKLVKEVFELNKSLIDLSFFPDYLFKKIANKIDEVLRVFIKEEVD